MDEEKEEREDRRTVSYHHRCNLRLMLQKIIEERAGHGDFILFDEMNRKPMHWDLVYKPRNISWKDRQIDRLRMWMKKDLSDKVSDICLIILDIEISFILNVSWAFGMIGLMITQGFAFASVAKMMEASGDPEFFRSLQILSAFSFLGLFGIGLGIWWSINSFEGRLLDWLAGKSRK